MTVDGKRIASLGTTVDAEKSEIRCDGSLIQKQRKIYFLLNKPRGYVCTNRDELDRLKAVDIIKNVTQRIYHRKAGQGKRRSDYPNQRW